MNSFTFCVLSSIYRDKKGSYCLLLMSNCSNITCWKAVLSPLNCFELMSKIRWAYLCGSGFWILSSVPLMYISIPSSIPQCPENHGYTICLNLGDSYSYTSYFFVKIILAILGPAHFYIIFRINLSIATKKLAGTLIEMALNGKTIWWWLTTLCWVLNSRLLSIFS